MIHNYILNNKIIKQRLGLIPKKIKLYEYLISQNINDTFDSNDIFIILHREKHIFKFNLFASFILEEIETPVSNYTQFIEDLSKFFSMKKEILERDINDFLIELKTNLIIKEQD